MKYVFGPVPSRRLGQSLGIDPIPLKTCNWNCVYCQLGRTIPLTNQRREYVPRRDIMNEVERALAAHKPGSIDWITFVGSGEPTLHSGLGWLIRRTQALTDLPVAVITNGALLRLPEVRRELAAADAVLPSLDAGNPWLYRKINRPWPRLTFEGLLEGLENFRRAYAGKLWLEVMLIRGMNDTEEALGEIADALHQIEPDLVHLGLPTRPPAEPWVRPADEVGMLRAASIFGDIAQVIRPTQGIFDLSGDADLTEALIAIITRHPMREDELIHTLDAWTPGQVQGVLESLAESGKARVIGRYGERFWSASAARYADQAKDVNSPAAARS